jgi:regulator of protease activity HflC (stomatin/prohibitin superfamily)
MKMIVEAYEKGLLYRDGRFVRVLEPGRYKLARWFRKDRIDKVDLRVQTIVVQGQETMTADKVAVRAAVLAKARIADPVAAVLKVANWQSQLYGDVQIALREAVAARTLDDLIAERIVLGDKVLGALRLDAQAYGVEVQDVAVRDLVLPGDLKAQYVRVLEARKKSEAAQIERREEVAATRSLANTAEMLARNPTLFKLKVLESLEKIAQAGAKVVLPADFLSETKKEA